MRQQLIQYVELLFAGAKDCEEIKQEILQNTLDRYDDLIAEGKVPEAAYRLAITGIGDINEILGASSVHTPTQNGNIPSPAPEENDSSRKKIMRAVAVGLYILCPVPLFILSELGAATLGLCGLLVMVAVATALIILGAKKDASDEESEDTMPMTPQQELRKGIRSLISAIGLVVYLVVSIWSGAWYITWLIFPIVGAVQGLANAILDLKEAVKHEN